MANVLVIGTDNEVNIDSLMQEGTDPPVYVNNAVITWTLQDPVGPTTLGTGQFNYTVGSEGSYTAIIPAALTATLQPNKQYAFIQSAVAVGFVNSWSDIYVAQSYPSSQFTYALRTDIEDIFGPTNVAKWADVDNNEDPVLIDRRIVWALKHSYDEMNSRLIGCPYAVPLQGAPPMIIRLQAQFAAVLLYESRGITDMDANGKPFHQLAWHRKDFEAKCKMLHAGTLRLPGGDQVSTTVPRVIRSHRWGRTGGWGNIW